MMDRRATAATLLLSSYFTAAELLGDDFDAMLSRTPWASAIDPAANWAIDRYFENQLVGVDGEAVADSLWSDEVEPRARRLYAEGGAEAVEAFYVAALAAILDDYWTFAPELVATEQAAPMWQLRDLARRAANEVLPDIRTVADELASAWHARVERI